MAKRSRQPPADLSSTSAESGPFNNALAQLAELRASFGDTPIEPTEAPPGPADEGSSERAYVLKGKLAVHKEKKGRGGKTATRIRGLQLDETALSALAKDMKRHLGCGAVVEDGDVVLLGDLRARAAQWLRANGATRVVGDT